MTIFVTGGAGYIGSHTILALLKAGRDIVSFDNYCNADPVALERVEELAGRSLAAKINGDIRDFDALKQALMEYRPTGVIHFAGLKAVGESVEHPLRYYDNNVTGSVNLLRAMDETQCQKIVFSSSATVYGAAQYLPIDENHPLAPTNPYGHNKLMIEQIIRDWCRVDEARTGVLLRYFNPIGADPSGNIGEDPRDIPNNLMPYIAQTAIGKLQKVNVYGGDYDTRDGTGERDYIHVVDLAAAHLAALDHADRDAGCEAVNIGTGQGVTVLEMIKTFAQVNDVTVPYEITERRPGDVASVLAAADKAQSLLGWQAKCGLEDMCRSTWHWQSQNPDGYATDGS